MPATIRRLVSFRSQLLAAVLALSISASACAARSPARSNVTASPNGTVVQVTMASADKVVALHVGDTLRILLGPPAGQALLSWQLRAYPKAVLTLLPRTQQREQFDLLAAAVGQGTVSLVGMVPCEAGPMAAQGVQCPVVGAGGNAEGGQPTPTGSQPAAPGAMPARLVVFEVTVTA